MEGHAKSSIGDIEKGHRLSIELTDDVLQILDEIERAKRRGTIVANVNGLVFTRDDGRAINKDIITQAVRVARKRAKVENVRFHDYRHSAKAEWSHRAFTSTWG